MGEARRRAEAERSERAAKEQRRLEDARATRAKPVTEKRKPLTRAQALALACRQATGPVLCGCGCGVPLDPLGEGVIDEHRRALGLLGGNELDNRALWRKPCSARKTAQQDVPSIAKAKRQAHAVGPREPSKRPLKSRNNLPRKGQGPKLRGRAFPPRRTVEKQP